VPEMDWPVWTPTDAALLTPEEAAGELAAQQADLVRFAADPETANNVLRECVESARDRNWRRDDWRSAQRAGMAIIVATDSLIRARIQEAGQPRPPLERNHSARPATLAAAAALAAYSDAGDEFNEHMSALKFAELAAEFAARHGLEDALLVKPDSVMQDMAARMLRAIRQVHGRA
jgi:hypothetical protein